MSDFHFLRHYWLLAVLPAFLLWWLIWRQQDDVAAWSKVVDPHLLDHLLVGKQKRQWLRPVHVLLVIWILSAIALAGPAWQREPSPFANDEAGLVILLKVSGTMNATDVQPSRLERAKHKLRDLLELRKGLSTSLIVYSGSAHLVMPLTKDHNVINMMIEDLTPELMPIDGDSLIEALDLAQNLIQKAGLPGSLLVMTDAVEPLQVQILAPEKMKLPVQFLSVRSPLAPTDTNLLQAAKKLNASVIKLSVQPSDVEEVSRRAQSEFKAAESLPDLQWHDAGYGLLPLIILCVLMWSRKGWGV